MGVRKFVCAALAVAAFGFAANAEVQPNAIGLRFGGGAFSGAELNYQRGMGGNRLEVGASWSFKSESVAIFSDVKRTTTYVGAVAVWQWHWDIAGVDGLNWYAGPAAGVGFWSWSYTHLGVKHSKSGMYADAGGQIGIEYDFNAVGVPVNLSFDIRPLLDLLNIKDDGFVVNYTLGLGLRYTF